MQHLKPYKNPARLLPARNNSNSTYYTIDFLVIPLCRFSEIDRARGTPNSSLNIKTFIINMDQMFYMYIRQRGKRFCYWLAKCILYNSFKITQKIQIQFKARIENLFCFQIDYYWIQVKCSVLLLNNMMQHLPPDTSDTFLFIFFLKTFTINSCIINVMYYKCTRSYCTSCISDYLPLVFVGFYCPLCFKFFRMGTLHRTGRLLWTSLIQTPSRQVLT